MYQNHLEGLTNQFSILKALFSHREPLLQATGPQGEN